VSGSAEIVVEARALWKTYPRGGLGELFRRPETGAPSAGSHVALAEVSLAVPRGGSVAIIGANGAGKSTLLRLLAGLAVPTRGELRCRGRRGALLELGAGFLDELDGATNARIALSLSGLAGRELDAAVDAAAAFSELGDFLREPIRVYSAGMRLRLAYAVAVAHEPDVLLADEVLAVGDEAFQRKCSRHIASFRVRGGTMVLASHNLYQVEKLCDEALWLREGRVAAAGAVRTVTSAYRAHVEESQAVDEELAREPGVAALAIASEDGRGGAPGVEIRVERAGVAEDVRVELLSLDGTLIAAFAAPPEGGSLELGAGTLLPAGYRARLAGVATGRLYAEQRFECRGASRELGSVRLPHRWE
jgi:lipopolysaccharide transport system ATP-binding protein